LESLALHVGAYDATRAVVRVPEAGDVQVEQSERPPSLEVHRGSFADRWRARIVLPEEWLPAPGAELFLGMSRTHGDTGATETSGLPGFPWAVSPSRAAARLESWNGEPPLGVETSPLTPARR
jgi:hypothetical protein